MTDLCRPLPVLPDEVPIRSGGCASAPPSATVSPVGAAGRAEVTAEVGGSGRTALAGLAKGNEIPTSAGDREEAKPDPCCPRCGQILRSVTLPEDHEPWVCMGCLTRQCSEAYDVALEATSELTGRPVSEIDMRMRP